MGVSISYKLQTAKPLIQSMLDRAEQTALKFKEIADKVNIPFDIRKKPGYLCIDIGGCESLSFRFYTPKQLDKILAKEGYSYQHAVLTDNGKIKLDEGYEFKKYPQNEKVYCANFCKTQYADNIIEHQWVAEILRSIASYCEYAEIRDEGDYYYTGDINDAVNSIVENRAIIQGVTGMLTDLGYEKGQIITNETKIQPFNQN
jgi:hypothetical protein